MSSSTTWKRLALAIIFAFLLAACGSDGDDAGNEEGDEAVSSEEEEASSEEEEASSGDGGSADLQLSSTDLGDILVDADGNTIYLFAPDDQGESTCYDECEAAWPIVGELSTAGDGLDASLLGTTDRTTGDVQATYNGWPLYYFANDAASGDTNGQAVNDVWFVIDAQGNAVSG